MTDWIEELEQGRGLPGWCRKDDRGFWVELPNGQMTGPWGSYKSATYAHEGMDKIAREIDEYGH